MYAFYRGNHHSNVLGTLPREGWGFLELGQEYILENPQSVRFCQKSPPLVQLGFLQGAVSQFLPNFFGEKQPRTHG